MMAKNKSIIKESGVTESIPSSKPINKYLLSEKEQLIKETIEKSLKDYIVETIQTPADSMFYNVNLSTKKEDLDPNDLELQRFLIAQQLSKVKADLFEALSKVLPLVNIKTGPYSFTKNDDTLCFAVTILLSDTDIRDWVTGRRSKDHDKNKKEQLKREENMMESKQSSKNKIQMNQKKSSIKNNKIKTAKILESIYNESRVKKSNNTKTKGTISILESLHYDVLVKEAEKKSNPNIPKEDSDLFNSRSKDMEKQFGKAKLDKLDSLIKDYKRIVNEIEEKERVFRKSIEKDVKISESNFAKIDKMLEQMKVVEYVVDGITAKVTQRKSIKGTTKWKSVVEDALKKLNDEGQKLLNKLVKKHTSFPEYPKQLNIESKQIKKINKLVEMIESRTGKKIYITESIGEYIKSVFIQMKSFMSTLSNTKNKLEDIASELGVDF